MKKLHSGQGIVEYALILVLIAVVAVVVIALVFGDRKTEFEKFNAAYDVCMVDGQFSHEDCVSIASQQVWRGGNRTTVIPMPMPSR